jgi:NAD(P)-dependent dehydrogenase (short-subunit alcohol dehydrogenase family)
MKRLDGKIAIITGATSGIGRRTAEIFVEEGATVVLAARRADDGEKIATQLGARASFVRTDVSREADIQSLFAQTAARFGRLDCLFNNAGGPVGGRSIEEVTADGIDSAMALLFRSVALAMKYAAPIMRRQGAGSIINNASIGGLRAGYSTSLVYGAAKAAVIHFTRCVAMELGESGIRVNSVSPGAIATGIFGKTAGLPVEAAERTAAIMKQAFERVQPIPRAGLPDDIARTVLWLASDDASFVNGQDIVVDGGLIGGRLWSTQQEVTQRMFDALRGSQG